MPDAAGHSGQLAFSTRAEEHARRKTLAAGYSRGCIERAPFRHRRQPTTASSCAWLENVATCGSHRREKFAMRNGERQRVCGIGGRFLGSSGVPQLFGLG
jgi:hypothetical protein